MTSERNEIVFRGGIQRTVWRRISTSQPNDAWDLAVMTLILIESMKLRFTEDMKPDYYAPKAAKDMEGPNGQPTKPKWGAVQGSGVPLPDGMDARQEHARAFYEANMGGGQRPPDKPRSRWGVQNRPIE